MLDKSRWWVATRFQRFGFFSVKHGEEAPSLSVSFFSWQGGVYTFIPFVP